MTPLTAGLIAKAARTPTSVTGRAKRGTTFESCLIRLRTTCEPATVAVVTARAVVDPTRLALRGVGEVTTSGSDVAAAATLPPVEPLATAAAGSAEALAIAD